jgi:isopenicillin N synthase-like dioxygenase
MQQSIPVVDLQAFLQGTPSQRDTFVADLGDALQDIGFVSLVGHGVDSDLIRRAYDMAETFFLLPDEAKRSYEDLALRGQRGFTSFGREKAKDHKAADLKEFWHVGRDGAGSHDNLWPDAHLPSFRPVFAELFRQLDVCADHLLRACALYLGEQERLLADMVDNGDTILRVIHYPPVAGDADPAAIRAAAHEDINFITLLCESTAPGLELLERDGTWRPIHALDGHIVVDAGDMLQQLTNGFFRSTTHRVVNPDNSRERRFSMPFFVHPRAEVDLTPLPSAVGRTGGEVRFPRITAGEYLLQRLREIGLA